MVADSGLARYAAVTTVVPLLSDGATVVLVMEERGADERRLDLAGAWNDLTRLLARALRDDHPAAEMKIALVEDRQSPSEIATIARLRGKPRRPASSYVDVQQGPRQLLRSRPGVRSPRLQDRALPLQRHRHLLGPRQARSLLLTAWLH
jgi:hypothetical protein